MKLAIQGLWHLGSVTAACCAKHFQVVGLDFDETVVAGLNSGRAPLLEPGLNELLASGIAAGRLRFSSDPALACREADLLWVTYDTPVNQDDEADVDYVMERVRRALPHLRAGATVLISAQLPVGTCRSLEADWPQLHFASSPENLRLGKAIHAFEKAERAIVGTRGDAPRALLTELFAPFAAQVIFMRTESAEMVKHALNSFLALSITYINEIARLSEHVGADAREVSVGLKSEPRIGPRAYLGPGGAFAGGTLARDVTTLSRLAQDFGEKLSVIPAIKQSNDLHRGWPFERLTARLKTLHGRKIAVLGLVYTPGTDTLRRSSAVELCQSLNRAGAIVHAFDPAITTARPELEGITISASADRALAAADAVVVCTEWPLFLTLDWQQLAGSMKTSLVVDPNQFLEKVLTSCPNVELISVGRTGPASPTSRNPL